MPVTVRGREEIRDGQTVKVRTVIETGDKPDRCEACYTDVPPHSTHECVRPMGLKLTGPIWQGRIEWSKDEK